MPSIVNDDDIREAVRNADSYMSALPTERKETEIKRHKS